MIFVAVPPAYIYNISGVHHRPLCTLATCDANHDEIPHPAHDYLEGHLWVQTVTGRPNEFSPVPQVTFTVPVLMPLQTPQRTPDSNRRVGVHKRALGQAHRPASKMRGRG